MNLLMKFNCIQEEPEYHGNRKLLHFSNRIEILLDKVSYKCPRPYSCGKFIRSWECLYPGERYKEGILVSELNRLQKEGLNI